MLNQYERDEILVRLDERVAVLHAGQGDQETRIRGLEKVRNWIGGVVSVILAFFGITNTI